MIRILIADDHPIVRHGLRNIISETSDMVVAGEASDGAEALHAVRSGSYDIVVLDITMPRMSGLEVLEHIRAEKPDLPVVVLSIHDEQRYALRALKSGAAAYLTKARASEELIEALKVVSQGRRYVTSSLAEKLAHLLVSGSKPAHESLSEREFQVMLRLAKGMRIAEIAKELFLSPKTISTYRQRLLQKLEIQNNAELTRYVIENRLVE